jgi:7-cyano-7-deazaguanine reductase
MPDIKLLECFPPPAPRRDFLIEHIAEEFTSTCPKTGHPDFGTVTVRFVPNELCVELKSLKLYLQSFRNEGIFYEAVTNKICDDLAEVMDPKFMEIITNWKGRGGIRSIITATYGNNGGCCGGDCDCEH